MCNNSRQESTEEYLLHPSLCQAKVGTMVRISYGSSGHDVHMAGFSLTTAVNVNKFDSTKCSSTEYYKSHPVSF